MEKRIAEHKYLQKVYKGVNGMDLQKFDEMIDAVQQQLVYRLMISKKKLLNKNTILDQILNMEEMRRGHYVIRSSKKMLEEMEFYWH